MEEQMPRTGAPIAALALAALMATSVVQAQEWPTRPVTMVVPFAAGGPVDVLGRILAQYLGEAIGKQVIVDNVPGGGGMTGSLRVSQAAPDGYMFVLASIGTHALNQTLSKKPLYNAATDFTPVALIADVGLVLITRKDLPPNNLAEFITYTKANQGKMQFGSAGAGSGPHVTCVLLNSAIGVTVTHVPYRGSAQAEQDLVAGRLDYLCDFIATALPQIRGNTVKAIATLTRERTPLLPDLATAHEQGLTDFDTPGWYALALPAKTPDAVVRRLNRALVESLETPAVRDRLQELGNTVPPPAQRTPEYFAGFIRSEIAKWAGPIRASGTVLE
jgi:tripartite-type tricarboxylate transporter receptor subunit TctC